MSRDFLLRKLETDDRTGVVPQQPRMSEALTSTPCRQGSLLVSNRLKPDYWLDSTGSVVA